MRLFGTTRVEAYVLRRTAFTLAAAFSLLAAVILLINFVALSRDIGQRTSVTFFDLLGLAGLQTPSVMLVLLPFVFLFGTLAAFVNFNRRSELVAMRAAGVSAWRFIFPAAAAGLVVGVLAFTVLNPVTTALDARFESARDRLGGEQTSESERRQRLWLRQPYGRGGQMTLTARAAEGAGVRLRDVSIYYYEPEGGTQRLVRRIDAPSAVLRAGRWILTDARESLPGRPAGAPATLSLPSTLDERTALQRLTRNDRVSFWGLPERIEEARAAGLSTSASRLQFHQLLATPLMLAGMSILAAAFSLRLLRLGGLPMLATSAIALGFLFFFINDLCGALGRAGLIWPAFAAWTPPALALLSGLTLLCYTEDG